MDTLERIEARETLMVGLAGRVDEKRRKRLAGKHLSPDFPLSLLLARGHITARQHAAGMWLGALYGRLFGLPHAGAQLGRLVAAAGKSLADPVIVEDLEATARASYEAGIAALDALSEPHLARALVHRYAVYLECDWWLRDVVAGEFGWRHRARLAVLRAALDALAEVRDARDAMRRAG